MEQLKEDFAKDHKSLREFATEVSQDLGQLANKNLENIMNQLNFLENKLITHLKEKYELQMNNYNNIELAIKPNGVLQERIRSEERRVGKECKNRSETKKQEEHEIRNKKHK